jgi:hypothetical protein
VRIASDPPMKHRDDDRRTWLVNTLSDELATAGHSALLISPYFVPGSEGVEGLSALAARGAQVGVVTNSLAANDVAAVHSGYMGYRVLLKAGVQLYELKAHGQLDTSLFGSSGASLHTKAFVVDGRRGFVGSFNLDPRSAYLNTEMGVLFDDPVLGAQLRDEYLRLASRSTAGGWPWARRWAALAGAATATALGGGRTRGEPGQALDCAGDQLAAGGIAAVALRTPDWPRPVRPHQRFHAAPMQAPPDPAQRMRRCRRQLLQQGQHAALAGMPMPAQQAGRCGRAGQAQAVGQRSFRIHRQGLVNRLGNSHAAATRCASGNDHCCSSCGTRAGSTASPRACASCSSWRITSAAPSLHQAQPLRGEGIAEGDRACVVGCRTRCQQRVLPDDRAELRNTSHCLHHRLHQYRTDDLAHALGADQGHRPLQALTGARGPCRPGCWRCAAGCRSAPGPGR